MGVCLSKSDDESRGTAGSAPTSSDPNKKLDDSHLAPVVLQKIGGKAKQVKSGAAHHVRNIFATPFEMMDFATYRPPVVEHSKEETELIEKALKKNFVFEHMSAEEMEPLVKAFEKTNVAADEVVIKQGDTGNYFYIILSGNCAFEVDDKEVGRVGPGNSFGELALLYNCPRAATVKATEASVLFRVDQKAFRYILQSQTKEGNKEKVELLRGVDFLKDLGEADVAKLVDVMTPKRFAKGDYLMHKGDEADNFYIFKEGKVKGTNISVGNVKYEDIEFGPGSYAGERAIMTGEKRAADAIALTDGLCFVIDKDTFANVFGKLEDVMSRAIDKQHLSVIKLFIDSALDDRTLTSLAGLIKDKSYPAGTVITTAGEPTRKAALYIIRSGKVEAKKADGTKKVLERGAYAGAESLTADVKSGKNGKTDPTTAVAEETLTVIEDCVVGVLTLSSMRRVINTKYLGTGNKELIASLPQNIKFKDLTRHTLLGAGTFGQVWLVSAKDKKPYALKVQSKYELIQNGQARAVVYEKTIMSKLTHPFLIHLVNTYQDEKLIYMLMQLVQGGELHNVIHTSRRHGVPEAQARFYAAGIAEGLVYMHRRGYVYRDLKPENVLIDSQGYPVIVDFGFAKYCVDKTYTLCGTPLYIAPEVILNRGHNWGADHWSLGVLIHEMLAGKNLFYKEGMGQMDLFRAIVACEYKISPNIPKEAASMISGLAKKDPSQRLGNLKGGLDDILNHPWFEPIDFEKLRNKEVKAMFVPKIKDPLDASNFDDWSHLDDKTKQQYPDLKPEEAAIFKEF